MVGPCGLPRDYNLRVLALCSVSLHGCAVAFLCREAHGSLCLGLIRIGYAHPDRLLSYPDVRFLSGCVLETVGGALRALIWRCAEGAVRCGLPRPRRYEMTNDGDSQNVTH